MELPLKPAIEGFQTVSGVDYFQCGPTRTENVKESKVFPFSSLCYYRSQVIKILLIIRCYCLSHILSPLDAYNSFEQWERQGLNSCV